jgi:hypothetical protein
MDIHYFIFVEMTLFRQVILVILCEICWSLNAVFHRPGILFFYLYPAYHLLLISMDNIHSNLRNRWDTNGLDIRSEIVSLSLKYLGLSLELARSHFSYIFANGLCWDWQVCGLWTVLEASNFSSQFVTLISDLWVNFSQFLPGWLSRLAYKTIQLFNT